MITSINPCAPSYALSDLRSFHSNENEFLIGGEAKRGGGVRVMEIQ